MSKIEWTEKTWNPTVGCSHVSPGCDHCYAARMARRHDRPGNAYEGTTDPNSVEGWSGKVNLLPERLEEPLRWRKPAIVFVDSMSDLFHAQIPREFIAQVFAIMALTPQHTYQILTKRPGRMRSMLRGEDIRLRVRAEQARLKWASPREPVRTSSWPLPNVWLGVSVENQAVADRRVPLLLDTPAAIRFVSAEPLLGPIDLRDALGLTWERCDACGRRYPDVYWADDAQWAQVVGDTFAGLRCPQCFKAEAKAEGLVPKIETLNPPLARVDWVIAGGESGPGARPMHPDWARALRDQCVDAGVPFFMKQWGEWRAGLPSDDVWETHVEHEWPDGEVSSWRVGKKAAGRRLDGRAWDEMPEVTR